MLLIVLPKQLTKQETNTKAESYLYPFQHARSEDVHASIDFVGDVLWRLFHKSLNLAILRMVDHNTILRGLIHFGHLIKKVLHFRSKCQKQQQASN